MGLLSSSVSLLIFCLTVLSVAEREGWESPAVPVELVISLASSLSLASCSLNGRPDRVVLRHVKPGRFASSPTGRVCRWKSMARFGLFPGLPAVHFCAASAWPGWRVTGGLACLPCASMQPPITRNHRPLALSTQPPWRLSLPPTGLLGIGVSQGSVRSLTPETKPLVLTAGSALPDPLSQPSQRGENSSSPRQAHPTLLLLSPRMVIF